MTITRASKRPTSTPRAKKTKITPDQFIEENDPGPARSPDALHDSANIHREQRALAVVNSYWPWAASAGILPLPIVDAAVIMGVQLRMLAKLAEEYGVPFREQAAKSVVATLMAMVLQSSLAGGMATILKVVPVVGSLLGVAMLPATAAAGTYAVGRVFITHLESGGTFLDFDPAKVQDHFKAEFAKAQARTGGRTSS